MERRCPLWCLLVIVLMVGCAAPQKAIYLAPTFGQVHVDTITLLPIVDSRTQSQFGIDEPLLQNLINPVVETGLNAKGYKVEFSSDSRGVQCLKFGRSPKLTPECLRSVGPPSARWVLVLFLREFQMRSPYGGTSTAKMFGILLDRSDGLMLWSDLEYAGLSQRELVGMNRNRSLSKEVIQICARKLINSLPQKKSGHVG